MSASNPSSTTTSSTSSRATGWLIAVIAVACIGSAALLGASVFGLGRSSAAPHVNPLPPAPVAPVVPITPSTPSTPTPAPSHHKVTPAPEHASDAVRLLQRELGQLNYYEGTANGYETAATVQAIKYLQRDAKLPRTGVLDIATQRALINFLITGNSQMAG